MSAEARSAQQTLRAGKILAKADEAIVREAMRQHQATAIALCKRVLIQNGIIRSDGGIAAPPPELASVDSRVRSQHAAPDGAEWQVGLGATWSQCTPKRLRLLMSEVDPVGMSDPVLRSMGKKHAREPPKPVLLQHFEHFLGLDPESSVPDVENEAELLAWLVSKYDKHGRRASRVPMPIDFSKGGSYVVVHENSMWKLQHSYSERVKELLQIDDPAGKLKLWIENNHSDCRARLKCKGNTSIDDLCHDMLGGPAGSDMTSTMPSPASTPRAKRPRLSLLNRNHALEDGSVDSPVSPALGGKRSLLDRQKSTDNLGLMIADDPEGAAATDDAQVGLEAAGHGGDQHQHHDSQSPVAQAGHGGDQHQHHDAGEALDAQAGHGGDQHQPHDSQSPVAQVFGPENFQGGQVQSPASFDEASFAPDIAAAVDTTPVEVDISAGAAFLEDLEEVAESQAA